MAKSSTPSKNKTYKFATLKAEAKKKAVDRPERKVLPPFVLDDVEPPIVISAPDTVERQLTIAECIGRDGTFDFVNTLPLLRALCGDQFGRVWMLVRDDKDPDALIGLVQAMVSHFEAEALADPLEANALPGGSEGS